MNENKNLSKFSIRAYQEDIDTISDYYPDLGYTRVIRHMITKLADKIRAERKDAIDSTIADIGEIDD